MPEFMTEAEILKDLEVFENEPLKIGPKTVPVPETETFQQKARAAVEVDEQKATQSEEKSVESPPDEQKAETGEEKLAETPPQSAEERARDEKGRFLAKEKAGDRTERPPDGQQAQQDVAGVDGEKPSEAQPSDTKPLTEYEKAKNKELNRQRSLLANFEEEKKREREFNKRERELIAREREFLLEQKRQAVAQGPKSDVIGYDHAGKEIFSSASLWKASLDFERDGRDDMAKIAREAIPASQRFEAQQARTMFENARARVISEMIAKEPELGDQTTPIYKEMASIYDEESQRAREHNRQPLFETMPDFMPIASEVAKLRLEARSNPGLREQLVAAQAEIKRLLGERQVNGATPGNPPPPQEWGALSTDKQLELMDAAMADAKKRMYR